MSSKVLEKNYYFLTYNFIRYNLSFKNKIYFIKKMYTIIGNPSNCSIFSRKEVKGHYFFKKFSSFHPKSDRFIKKSLSKISIRLKDNPFFEYELYVIIFLRFFIDNDFFHSLLRKSYVKILHGEYDSLYIDKYRLKHVFFEKENKSWYDRYITKYYKTNNYFKDPIWKSISECFRQLHILLFILGKDSNYRYSLKRVDSWKNFSHGSKYISCYYQYFIYDLKWSVVFLLRILRYSQSVLDSILYHTYERYLYYKKILSSYLKSFTLFWLFFLLEQHSFIRKKRKLSFDFLNRLLLLTIQDNSIFFKISLKESYKNSYYYVRSCFSKVSFPNRNGEKERRDISSFKTIYIYFLYDLYFFEQEQDFLYNFLLNINYVVYTIKNSKNKIASHYDFLISFLSRKYSSTEISYEDILIYSTKGLYKAIDRFEVHKNCKFTTYAFWWVKQSVSKLIQDTLIRIPSEYILFLKDLDRSKKTSDFSFSKEFIKSLLNLLYQERSYYYIKSTDQNKRLLAELRFLYNLDKKKVPIGNRREGLEKLNEFSPSSVEYTSPNSQDIYSVYKTNVSILRVLLSSKYPYKVHPLHQVYKLFNVQDNKFKSYVKNFISTKVTTKI